MICTQDRVLSLNKLQSQNRHLFNTTSLNKYKIKNSFVKKKLKKLFKAFIVLLENYALHFHCNSCIFSKIS